jgi:hypothetical protein
VPAISAHVVPLVSVILCQLVSIVSVATVPFY